MNMHIEEKLQSWITYMREHPDEFPAYSSWFHGITHWQHVEAFGLLLAREVPEADTDVIRWFAFLHDCRRGTFSDIEHGVLASRYISTIRRTFLSGLSDEQVRTLKLACRYHTIRRRTGNPTADICLDADRLDLPRVSITPDPRKMATDVGSRYSKLSYHELIKAVEL